MHVIDHRYVEAACLSYGQAICHRDVCSYRVTCNVFLSTLITVMTNPVTETPIEWRQVRHNQCTSGLVLDRVFLATLHIEILTPMLALAPAGTGTGCGSTSTSLSTAPALAPHGYTYTLHQACAAPCFHSLDTPVLTTLLYNEVFAYVASCSTETAESRFRMMRACRLLIWTTMRPKRFVDLMFKILKGATQVQSYHRSAYMAI